MKNSYWLIYYSEFLFSLFLEQGHDDDAFARRGWWAYVRGFCVCVCVCVRVCVFVFPTWLRSPTACIQNEALNHSAPWPTL